MRCCCLRYVWFQRMKDRLTVRLMRTTTVDTATSRKDRSSGYAARHTNTRRRVSLSLRVPVK